MAMKSVKGFFKKVFANVFKNKKDIRLGFYGPPNAGKTSLANRICKDFTGEEIGSVSKVPHETRKVQFKEKVEIEYKGKKMTFKMEGGVMFLLFSGAFFCRFLLAAIGLDRPTWCSFVCVL